MSALHTQPIKRGAPRKVVLLRPDDHSRPADARVPDGLCAREFVVRHHVRADERPRPAEARLAVHGDAAAGKVRAERKEFLEDAVRRVVAVGEDKVKVKDP